MPNLRKAKSKNLNMVKKELFYAYLIILILLHSIYKKCDVDHKIVIFLNQNYHNQSHYTF